MKLNSRELPLGVAPAVNPEGVDGVDARRFNRIEDEVGGLGDLNGDAGAGAKRVVVVASTVVAEVQERGKVGALEASGPTGRVGGNVERSVGHLVGAVRRELADVADGRTGILVAIV